MRVSVFFCFNFGYAVKVLVKTVRQHKNETMEMKRKARKSYKSIAIPENPHHNMFNVEQVNTTQHRIFHISMLLKGLL